MKRESRVLLGVAPVVAGADVHHEGHGQLADALHLLFDHARDGVEFVGWAFEDQFVAHLEQHGGLVPGRCQRRVDAHHGQLDEIRR